MALSWIALVITAQIVLPAHSSAQSVQGIVTSGDPAHPVHDAEVRVISLADATEYPPAFTDDSGQFRVSVVDSGHHALWIRKIGYRPQHAVFSAPLGGTVHVAVVLDEFVVEVEGIIVFGIAAVTEGQREFWSRRHVPWNTSVDYTEIEQLHQGKVSEIVQVLPLSVRCRPIVYVDGVKRRSMDEIPLDWVYGIEVYRGYYNIPFRYRDPFGRGAQCGAVLLWTKSLR